MSCSTATTKKRKVSKPGIYDPNYSSDPQFGNVSTLPDGQKRIHNYFRDEVDKDDYYRISIFIPDCEVPAIHSRQIDEVTEFDVPIIKNFHVELIEGNNIDKKSTAHVAVGIFEKDRLSLGPFPSFGDFPEATLSTHEHEAVFIMNDPIAYAVFESGNQHCFSNIPERGYTCLQNYVCLYISVHDMKTDPKIPLSLHIMTDYTWCKMKYKDALIWKADFEKNIQKRLKYRLISSGNKTFICSRGEVRIDESADPSKFPQIQNNAKSFRVAERSLAGAMASKQVLWGETIKKYMK